MKTFKLQSSYTVKRAMIHLVALTFSLGLGYPPQAQAKSVYEASKTLEWQRLLFYASSWFGGYRSVIDAPSFFHNPKGNTDPYAELQASITALGRDTSTAADDEHPQCRFPARHAFVQKHLPDIARTLPQASCPMLESFLAHNRFNKISLVFTSYFPNSPASTFGHTFLRLRRADHAGRAAMLDTVVNFAAELPPKVSSIGYFTKGLGGGFPGKFYYIPYFAKIQEYSHAESRDLWEYELSYNPDQITQLLQSVWELIPHHIDYYYLDDNCSYVLLILLNTLDTRFDLIKEHRFWNTPLATLQSVVQSPAFSGHIYFTPSAKTKFDRRYEKLPHAEQLTVQKLLTRQLSIAALQTEVTPPKLAAITDTALDLIDYKERLAGSMVAQNYPKLRRDLLHLRASLPSDSSQRSQNIYTESQRPDLAHPSTRLGMGLYNQQGHSGPRLEWLPALHSLSAVSQGFPEAMEVQFLGLKADATQDHKLTLAELIPIKVFSAATDHDFLQKRAWLAESKITRSRICPQTSSCYHSMLGGGMGLSWRYHSQASGFALMTLFAGATQDQKQDEFISPGLMLGSGWDISSTWRLHSELRYQHLIYEKHKTDAISWHNALSRRWQPSLEQRLEIGFEDHPRNIFSQISMGFYF